MTAKTISDSNTGKYWSKLQKMQFGLSGHACAEEGRHLVKKIMWQNRTGIPKRVMKSNTKSKTISVSNGAECSRHSSG